MKNVILGLCLLMAGLANASTLHRGWETGTCNQIHSQIDSETSKVWNSFSTKTESYVEELEKASNYMFIMAMLENKKIDLDKDYENIARVL